MTDANVAVNFQRLDERLRVRRRLRARGARQPRARRSPIINSKYAALGAALAESHARALQAMQSGDNAAYADSLRAAQEAISGQIRAEQDGLERPAGGLCRRRAQPPHQRTGEAAGLARGHRAGLRAELDLVEPQARAGAMARSPSGSASTIRSRNSSATSSANSRNSRARRSTNRRKPIAQFGDAVAGAFNSQLRGSVVRHGVLARRLSQDAGATADRIHRMERAQRRAMGRRRGRQDGRDRESDARRERRSQQAAPRRRWRRRARR